jgi:hypothetical protein
LKHYNGIGCELQFPKLCCVRAHVLGKKNNSIFNPIQSCRFDDELCSKIQLKVNCNRMMPVPYEVL